MDTGSRGASSRQLRRTALLHHRPSYSANAEYPVRRSFSIRSRTSRNTGSSAFADDDDRECGVLSFIKRTFAFPPRDAPEFCLKIPPSSIGGCSATPRGEQGKPGARCTRSRACSVESTRVSHHRSTGTPGLPCATVLTVSFVLSPVIGLYCHRRQRNFFHQLDANH